MARYESHVRKANQEERERRRAEEQEKNRPRCYNCEQLGHIARDCRVEICGTCKGKGHRSHDCPVAHGKGGEKGGGKGFGKDTGKEPGAGKGPEPEPRGQPALPAGRVGPRAPPTPELLERRVADMWAAIARRREDHRQTWAEEQMAAYDASFAAFTARVEAENRDLDPAALMKAEADADYKGWFAGLSREQQASVQTARDAVELEGLRRKAAEEEWQRKLERDLRRSELAKEAEATERARRLQQERQAEA